jgi:hypothetical protein
MQWKVQAYRGKNREINLGKSFVHADTEAQAIDLGKRALKMIGVRGRFLVSASIYRPERDIAFLGYIAEVKE